MPGSIFKGRLCGFICPDCPEPLSNATVRLYRNRDEQQVSALAAASPKDTFAILTDDEVQAKQSSLLAEGTTDEQGAFALELGKDYDGGAFEVDVYCGTVPHRKPPKGELKPVQFSITTVHPQWRESEDTRVAAFEYCVPARYWCEIRRRFGAWTICGEVTVCETKEPVAGVRVRAFDRDWLQDDALGSGLTDAAGKFRIDYTADDFKRTPFSWLELEWVGGPDLYFRVELPDGTPLLEESPDKGRTPGRENAGPCTCVHLCLDRVPPSRPAPIPLFTNVGSYAVDPPAGAFTADGTTTAGHMAFTGTIPLIGILPNGDAPDAEQYRFFVEKYPGPGAAQNVVASMIPATPIGKLEYFEFAGGAWKPNAVDFWVNNPGASVSIPQAAGPDLVVSVNTDVGPDGWIDVPRLNELFPGGHGLFKHQELLAYLDTRKLSDQHFDLTVPAPPLKAGASVPAAKLAEKPVYRITFEARKVVGPTPIGSNQLAKIAISNTSYTFLRHPEWAGGPVTAHSVVSLDIAELTAPGATGCDEIQDHLHALFTAYNPYLGDVQVYFEGNPPLPAAVNPPVVGGEAASGAAGHDFDTSALLPCAFIIWLQATAQLTSGYGLIGGATIWDHIAFCKR
jgi:hypothetical protein